LSLSGFTGTITVLDTASNLASIAHQFATAPIGSGLLVARGAMVATLSANATVSAQTLDALETLPGMNAGGHVVTVMDTPNALLDAFPGAVPLATQTVLAATSGTWVVSASDAAHLATMPGFSAGTSGMAVSDSVANILTAANGAGIAAATGVELASNATVTAATAMALHALPNFIAAAHA